MKIPIDDIAAYLKAWPLGDLWYIEDEVNQEVWAREMDCNNVGYAVRTPGTIVRLEDFEAVVYYQGPDEDPTHGEGYSLVRLIKQFRKNQTTTTMVFSVPKGHEQGVEKAVKLYGGKLVKS